MLVTNKEILKKAQKAAYAIGAFNIQNLESLLAVVEAAAEERSPVIVAVTPGAIKYGGLNYLARLVKTAAETVPVPMSLHLDHGEDVETVKKCLEAGFTSVMIDGSHLPIEENIALTKRVVDVAHQMGVSV
ncbi:MAG: class II fructose-bisphosphate aldolase, partial [Candidatus Bathyarchaeia archaeon]